MPYPPQLLDAVRTVAASPGGWDCGRNVQHARALPDKANAAVPASSSRRLIMSCASRRVALAAARLPLLPPGVEAGDAHFGGRQAEQEDHRDPERPATSPLWSG